MVPKTRSWLGQLQSLNDQIWTGIGHEPSWILWQSLPCSQEGNCQHCFWIQIVRFFFFNFVFCFLYFYMLYYYFHSGDVIPIIEYTADEIGTWTAVFNNVLDLMPKHFCMEYRNAFKMLQDDNIFTPNKIPQLREMSDFLKKHTGFTLRPAAGLLTARDFLASLAFRVFQSTQYIRHSTSPFHTPEP